MELGHLLTLAGLTYQVVSSKVCHLENSVSLPSVIYYDIHPHLFVVYPILANEEMTTESQRYNCFIRNGGNASSKHAGPEAKGSNPTTGLTLSWARNPFRGNLTTCKSHGKKPDILFSIILLPSAFTDEVHLNIFGSYYFTTSSSKRR
jgi:hypothetical protein